MKWRVGSMSQHVIHGAVLVCALTAAELPPQDQRPTFRATTDVVTVDVSVRQGTRVVNGLKAADFEVFDNDVPQQVVDVSFGKLPIDVTVALDVSFSVTGTLLDQLRRAVSQLMSDLGKEDRLRLLLFNARVRRTMDFTADVKAVERAIREAVPGGGTTLFDALSVALVSSAHPDRRQLVVCFTDGNDSTSVTDVDTLFGVAQRTNATLSMVVPSRVMNIGGPNATTGAATSTITTTAMPSALSRVYALLTNETGGSIVAAGGDLGATFRRTLDEFRSTYVLHFSPKGVDRTGFHTLSVRVNRTGLTIKSRRGYFAG
jgi:VWFA-related protein